MQKIKQKMESLGVSLLQTPQNAFYSKRPLAGKHIHPHEMPYVDETEEKRDNMKKQKTPLVVTISIAEINDFSMRW